MPHDYMTLMGAEDVRSAGHRIASAAHEISGAASTMSGAAHQIQMVLDNFMIDFNRALDRLAEIQSAGGTK